MTRNELKEYYQIQTIPAEELDKMKNAPLIMARYRWLSKKLNHLMNFEYIRVKQCNSIEAVDLLGGINYEDEPVFQEARHGND